MFIVLEIYETTEGAAPQVVNYPRVTKNEALSTYHYILYQAAVSQHYRHSAVVMQPDGKYIDRDSFIHVPEVEDETEPEGTSE